MVAVPLEALRLLAEIALRADVGAVAADARDLATIGRDLEAAVHVAEDAGGLVPRLVGHGGLRRVSVPRRVILVQNLYCTIRKREASTAWRPIGDVLRRSERLRPPLSALSLRAELDLTHPTRGHDDRSQTPASVPAPPPRPAPKAASRPTPAAERTRRTWAWADLMRRIFAIDVLACAGCGGRLRFLATIEDPPVVTKILAHLGLPTERPALIPARPPPQPDGFDFP